MLFLRQIFESTSNIETVIAKNRKSRKPDNNDALLTAIAANSRGQSAIHLKSSESESV